MAARARLALQADGHHQMVIKMGMIEPDKEEVESTQTDESTKHLQPSLLENQDQSTHIHSLTDSGIDERQDNQIDGFGESFVHASTESQPPNRKETITRALRLILILGVIAIAILVLFNKFGQQNPDSAKAYFNRGLSYYDKGDQDQAISNYDKAIQLDPNFALAYYQRGLSYQKKGDFDRL